MTCSFYICLARNTRSWDVKHTFLPTKPYPTNHVSCQNSESFSAKSLAPFSLQATINHFGTLQERHYWSFKSDKHASKWLKCNDTSGTLVQQKSLTIFGCDNPTYNPSPIQGNQVCSLDFSGLTYLQYPSFHEKHCTGTCLTSLVFVV